MFSCVAFLQHTCCIFTTHEKPYKHCYISVYLTLKTCSLLTLYIRAKSSARNRLYFLSLCYRKSPPFGKGYSTSLHNHPNPCPTFFGTCNVITKPTDEKGNIVSSAWICKYTCRTAFTSVLKLLLFYFL